MGSSGRHKKLSSAWPKWLCCTITGEEGPQGHHGAILPLQTHRQDSSQGDWQNPSLPSQSLLLGKAQSVLVIAEWADKVSLKSGQPRSMAVEHGFLAF